VEQLLPRRPRSVLRISFSSPHIRRLDMDVVEESSFRIGVSKSTYLLHNVCPPGLLASRLLSARHFDVLTSGGNCTAAVLSALPSRKSVTYQSVASAPSDEGPGSQKRYGLFSVQSNRLLLDGRSQEPS